MVYKPITLAIGQRIEIGYEQTVTRNLLHDLAGAVLTSYNAAHRSKGHTASVMPIRKNRQIAGCALNIMQADLEEGYRLDQYLFVPTGEQLIVEPAEDSLSLAQSHNFVSALTEIVISLNPELRPRQPQTA